MKGWPPCALDDEMFTIRPQPASIMWGTTAWQQWNVPVRLTSILSFQCSRVMSRNGMKLSRPALLTRMSGAPSRSTTSTTASSIRRRSVTSTFRPMARPPPASIPRAAVAAASPLRSKMATAAPSLARRSLMARPMPDAPPVTTVTRGSLQLLTYASSLTLTYSRTQVDWTRQREGTPAPTVNVARAPRYVCFQTRSPT